MHTLLNIKNNSNINFPSDIDELDPVQYLAYIKLIHNAEVNNMPIKELRRHLLKIVFPIDFGLCMLKMSKSDIDAMWERIYQWSEKMDSFFDIEETNNKRIYKVHLKSGANLLPAWNNYQGPEDMLNNITWGEFVSCMNLLNVYKDLIDSRDTKGADAIMTDLFYVLYKPKSKKKKKVEVPMYIKLHAFYFFSHVFELVSTVPIPIHGSEIDFSIIFSDKGSTEKDNKMGWNGLVFAVAESGVFGKTEDVNKESFWSVMLYLYKCAFDNQNLKDKK